MLLAFLGQLDLYVIMEIPRQILDLILGLIIGGAESMSGELLLASMNFHGGR